MVKQVLLSKPPGKDPAAVFSCPVCGAVNAKMHPLPPYYFQQWQQYQTIHNPLHIETLNIAQYMCANCHSADRDRLYALFLKDYLRQNKAIRLLDIAPAQGLNTFIKSFSNVQYRSMDLMMDNVDDHLDITDMNIYADEQFDCFICSHVLEHIPDDRKAMRELYRIVKKGGCGIAMVPINLDLQETVENPGYTEAALKWKYFFQDDHVRMYAKKDFITRLTAAGFTVEQLGMDHFTKEVFERNAIYPTSVLYVVTKQ